MCVSGSRGEQQKLFFVIGFAVAYSDWIVFVSKKKKKRFSVLLKMGLRPDMLDAVDVSWTSLNLNQCQEMNSFYAVRKAV